MLTIKQAARNIHKVAKEATTSNWELGNSWYSIAHEFCVAQAKAYNVPLPQVVGVLAVLSPQCAWETNKLATSDMLATGTTSRQCYPKNITKAQRILAGETFEAVTYHRRYGHKVRAFYANILEPETSQVVTVDTHAIRAAFDRADLTTRHIEWVFACGGNRVLQEAYKLVASTYAITPNKLQATVWLRVKDSLEGI